MGTRMQWAGVVSCLLIASACGAPTPSPGDSGTPPDGGAPDAGLVVEALEGGLAGFDFAAVVQEGYWYSRYNLGSLVMMSGMGDTFMPADGGPEMMAQMASDAKSTAMLPKNPALLKRVFNAANPAYAVASNGDAMDLANGRWTSAIDAGTSAAAAGWTSLKQIEWGKQFHVDAHFGELGPADTIPGAQQRFEGLVLYAESVMQAMEVANNAAAFDLSDPGGGYVLLAALADTVMITRATTAPRSTSNRMRAMGTQMAMMMGMADADALAMMIEGKANAMYQSLPEPATLDGLAKGVTGLTWYGAAVATNRAAVKTKLKAFGDKILAAPKPDAAALARAIRALHDVARNSGGDPRYKAGASSAFAALVADYRGRTGSFKSVTRLSADDVAWLLGALGATIKFGSAEESAAAEKVLVGLFEAAVNISGLQISAPPVSSVNAYEKLPRDLFHRYPSLPVPPAAGGTFGVAPVFASEVTFSTASGKWSAAKDRFDSAGGMHLANEMLWLHVDEVDGYPTVP